jgi:hypothetical protein
VIWLRSADGAVLCEVLAARRGCAGATWTTIGDGPGKGASGSRWACADPDPASSASDPPTIMLRARGVMKSFPDYETN